MFLMCGFCSWLLCALFVIVCLICILGVLAGVFCLFCVFVACVCVDVFVDVGCCVVWCGGVCFVVILFSSVTFVSWLLWCACCFMVL